MSANYVLIEKISVGAAGASSVTFSGIPQTGYTDLVVKISGRSTSSDDQIWISLNGSTTGFSNRVLYGSGSTAASTSVDRFAAYQTPGTGTTTNTFGNSEIYIPNYTGSTNKSMSGDTVWEQNASTAYAALNASLWSNTAAITSITLTPQTSNFAQYSTFYLYGVAALGTTPAIVPYATGGDTIMTDGTYWYHTFLSSGTFTPTKSLSCDYLVVAGGGSGGDGWGAGGGGAGGLRSTVTATGGGGSLESKLSLGTSAYTVTIGAGGPQQTALNTQGNNGSNSVFATITSTGGGGGGGTGDSSSIIGNAGGSGGGGSRSPGNGAGGAGTANQGYAGGTGEDGSSSGKGGGGGGAGAVGANGATRTGGAGVATSISGSSVTYAGGGGGGNETSGSTAAAGGAGGGGAGGYYTGSSNVSGVAGTANTGGGGGGSGRNQTGGMAGGSGIVIVRYAV